MSNTDNALSTGKIDPNLFPMTLKKQLRFYIEKRDMTATQLARKSNVPKQSMSGWLSGSNPRDVKQVKRVADALGVSLDNLLFGTGEDTEAMKGADLGALLSDEWLSGTFEMKIRRVKK